MRALNVWWGERIAGQLSQNRHGELGFLYAPDWLADDRARALSASLPKRAEPYSRRQCRPFFAGLLPEEGQRDAVALALGVSRRNDFALLDRLGGDVAGALQLLPPGDSPAALSAPRPTPLDEAGLIRVLDALPSRPLLAGEDGMRLSLAGAQSKIPVVLVNAAVALPAPGQPTTQILKPPIARLKATTENEAFVMRLAAAVGLDVALVEARHVRDRTFLLVQRYDRSAAVDDGGVRRIHQEDFCQALGVPPEMKYAGEGGPTFKDCFALLRRLSARPALDVLKLLDAAILNLVAGNADAHGKNFSILYGDQGPRLAPLYDLLSTIAYPDLSPKLAMKIGRRTTLAEMDAKGWAGFASDAGIGLPLVRRRIGELCAVVTAAASGVAQELARPGFDADALAGFADLISERARRCAATIRK